MGEAGDIGEGMRRRGFLGVVAAAGMTAAATGCSDAQSSGVVSAPKKKVSVVAEQDRAGSPDWRIRSFGPDNAIEGYTDKASVLPGEDVSLHVSTTAAGFRVSAYRVGWYGGAQARLVWRSDRITAVRQPAASSMKTTRTVQAGWQPNVTVHTAGWPEGAYLFRLDADSGHQRYVPMIVRSATATGKTLIMHSTATWQAYNKWGGASLYTGKDGTFDTRSLSVSFDRPYDEDGADRFMTYERAAVVLAERLRIPVAYTTGVDVAVDPSILKGATAIFSLGHDEYWTPGQRGSVTQARDAGTNLAFLGANACYRRIRLDHTEVGQNRMVICYKSDTDPISAHSPASATTDFRLPPAADPESSLTGVYYEGYPVDAPYVVHAADHWLFAGTGVRNGDSFEHLVGVEYDRVTPGVPTPRPIEIIGHSPLVCGGSSSHSDSAYYTVPSGAGVFASGTMRWVEGLMAGTGDDGRDHQMDARTARFVAKATSNLLLGFAKGPAAHAYPAPRDNLKAIYA